MSNSAQLLILKGITTRAIPFLQRCPRQPSSYDTKRDIKTSEQAHDLPVDFHDCSKAFRFLSRRISKQTSGKDACTDSTISTEGYCRTSHTNSKIKVCLSQMEARPTLLPRFARRRTACPACLPSLPGWPCTVCFVSASAWSQPIKHVCVKDVQLLTAVNHSAHAHAQRCPGQRRY